MCRTHALNIRDTVHLDAAQKPIKLKERESETSGQIYGSPSLFSFFLLQFLALHSFSLYEQRLQAQFGLPLSQLPRNPAKTDVTES